MAQVNVTISGRQFRMACDDGQEAHLTQLAKELDDRILELRAKFGEVGDTRLTIMAALTVADELAEAAKTIRRLEEELSGLREARVRAADRAQATQAAVVAAFSSAAERIESIARRLNQPAARNNDVAVG